MTNFSYAMKTKGVFWAVLLCTFWGQAQYTLIPDPEFERRLIEQGIDSEGTLDGQVLTSDIEQIDYLNIATEFPVTPPYIQDLTGIEDFVALEFLNFGSNAVEEVDLSQNLNLKVLVCKFNNLTSLDISNNLLLENLDVLNCPTGTCDQENVFPSLDLSNNTNLKNFIIGFHNYISDLDFSANTNAEVISVGYCPNIQQLNVRNGTNSILSFFAVNECPLLTCITVDDPVAATAGDSYPYDQWNIQEGVFFSEDCSLGYSKEVLAHNLRLYPSPIKDLLYLTTPWTIERITLTSTLGTEAFSLETPGMPIDLSTLPTGMYLVIVETSQGSVVKKIVKE
ncbi:MAG: T9SS type A sorting domain-containing protein [Flavobacteriaceae bacterium]